MMIKFTSLVSYTKSIPVVGWGARLAIRAFRFSSDLDKVRAAVGHGVLGLKHFVSWHFLVNPQSRKLLVKHKPALTPTTARVLTDLTAKGIAITTIGDLGIDFGDWDQLRQEVQDFSKAASELLSGAIGSSVDSLKFGTLGHNIDRFRRIFSDKHSAVNDDYIIKMYPENSIFPSDHPLIAIGLSPAILNIVNSYFGLWSKLIYADVWHTIPIYTGMRVGSQRWHRDPEDRKIIKVYLCFSEIDQDAGPMEYIPRTSYTANQPSKEIVKWKASGGTHYPLADVIEQRFAPSEKVLCSGPIGTLIFCDTTGFHRGGIPQSKARIVATWTFVTPASLSKKRFSVRQTAVNSLSEEGWFALK